MLSLHVGRLEEKLVKTSASQQSKQAILTKIVVSSAELRTG